MMFALSVLFASLDYKTPLSNEGKRGSLFYKA